MRTAIVRVIFIGLIFWAGMEWGGHLESQRIYGLSRDERGLEQARRLPGNPLDPWWIVREVHFVPYDKTNTGFAQWQATLERGGGEITLDFGGNHPSYSDFERHEVGVNSSVRVYCWETRQDRTAGSDEIARWLLLEKKKPRASP